MTLKILNRSRRIKLAVDVKLLAEAEQIAKEEMTHYDKSYICFESKMNDMTMAEILAMTFHKQNRVVQDERPLSNREILNNKK